jgi:hypothetical protein
MAVGNADAHARDFSLLHEPGAPAIGLASVYDVWGIRPRAASGVVTETLDQALAAIPATPGDAQILTVIRASRASTARLTAGPS